MRTVAIGAGHIGWYLKQEVVSHLNGKLGFDHVEDLSRDRCQVDYPRLAEKVANVVANTQNGTVGILIGRTGMGMCMAANKVRGVRATACYTKSMAIIARQRIDSNILCLGASITAWELALEIVTAWYDTEFSDERDHHRQITQVGEIEAKQGFLERYTKIAGPMCR